MSVTWVKMSSDCSCIMREMIILTYCFCNQALNGCALSFIFIFACDNLTINVKLDDLLQIVCPNTRYQFYRGHQNDAYTTIYENVYYLGEDKHAYEMCNATGRTQYSYCVLFFSSFISLSSGWWICPTQRATIHKLSIAGHLG